MSVDCRFCRGERPAADHKVADLGTSVLYLNDDQFFPGWVVLVLKRHATELFELEPDERAQMIHDVSRVAKVLQELFVSRKINYACLGNQIAHVHWHVTPRLHDDPAPLEAIWNVPHTPLRLAPDARTERIAKVRSRLGL